MKQRLECTISGRVQMVMYRDFATRNARKLGLVGEVWNNSDGTVGLIVEGEKEALAAYCLLLEAGSLLSQVEKVEKNFSEPKGVHERFVIRYKK